MPEPTKRLDDLRMTEISGVDHPAHLEEGWLVLKARDDNHRSQEATVPEFEPINKEALDPSIRAYIETLESAVTKAEKDLEDAEAEAKVAAEAAAAPAAEPTEDEALEKALSALPAPLRKHLADTEARAAAAESVAKAEMDRRLNDEFVTKAASLNALSLDPTEFGPILRKAAEAMGEESVTLFEVLKAANDTVATANLMIEVGSGSGVASASTEAYGSLEALAKARTVSHKEDFATALTAIAAENPDLYAQYLTQSRKGA